MGWIYKIINSVNDKVYVGQTHYSIAERWKHHKYVAFQPSHVSYNTVLYCAIRKYGIENFDIVPIEECPQEKLDEREIYWIKQYESYDNGYNSTRGGKGHRIYEEQIVKDFWDKGYNLKRICNELHITATTIKKILGDYSPFIEQREQRYLEAASDKTYESLPVKQFSLDGDYIATYPSISEAERQTGTDKSTIMRVCKGRSKYANDFQWRYEDDDSPVIKVRTRKVPIIQVDENNNIVNEYPSMNEAARSNGLCKAMISYAVRKGIIHKGFYWRRKEEI